LIGTQVAACAALVFDHEGLTKRFAQIWRNGAGQDVGGAAGCEGHDDFDGFARPGGLRPGCRRGRQKNSGSQSQDGAAGEMTGQLNHEGLLFEQSNDDAMQTPKPCHASEESGCI
jgi:hypothetical protein